MNSNKNENQIKHPDLNKVDILWGSNFEGGSFKFVSLKYIETIRNNSDLKIESLGMNVNIEIIFKIIIKLNPKYFIVLFNDSNLKNISENLKQIRNQWTGKFIPFVPIEYANPILNLLTFDCDFILTINEWSKEQIKKTTKKNNIEVLEHIVEDYHELSRNNKISLREKYYGSKNAKKFIVGVVNARNSRKRLDLSINAFNLFNKINPDSLLVIKTTKYEQSPICPCYSNFDDFIENKESVIIIDDLIDEIALNNLYNTFDIMINTTDGEGFGLTPFEGYLSGVLSILPYHSSFISLLPDKNASYFVNSEMIPYEYARNNIDYLEMATGKIIRYVIYYNEKKEKKIIQNLSFLEKEKDIDVFIFSCLENSTTTIIELYNLAKTKSKEFYIGVTSDLNSLRRYYDQINDVNLDNLFTEGEIKIMKKSSLNAYIGYDTPHVGIVNPEDICQKMIFFYHNPSISKALIKNLKEYVLKEFNAEKIMKKMISILDKHSDENTVGCKFYNHKEDSVSSFYSTDEIIPGLKNTTTYNTKYGKITLLSNDVYFINSFNNGIYWDEDTMLKLKDYIPKNKNILEIGGHCGTSTIFYAKYINDNNKVYVFEPQKKMCEILIHNLKQNNIDHKVVVYNKGCFCINKYIYMNDIDLDGPNINTNIKDLEINSERINYGGLCLGKNGEKIEVCKIDDINEINNIGFIHCDAQGSENYIFMGAEKLITKFKPCIFYENNTQYGKYLCDNIKDAYPGYIDNYNIKTLCIEQLNYSVCIDKFNGDLNTLLIP